jgi:tetratricopeptide (TPR) repeat protein
MPYLFFHFLFVQGTGALGLPSEGELALLENRWSSAELLCEKGRETWDEGHQLAWFLARYAQGDVESTIEAGLAVLAQDPNSQAAEFVLAYLGELQEHFPGWIDRSGSALLLQPPSAPGPKVLASQTLRLLAAFRDDAELLEKVMAESGFLRSWRFSPRFGQYPIPDFAREWSADKAQAWDLNWPVTQSQSGLVTPPADSNGPGVLMAYSLFKVEEQADFILRFHTLQNASLYLDGKLLLQRLNLQERLPSISYLRINLSRGEHEFMLRITQGHRDKAQFALQLSGGTAINLAPTLPRFPAGKQKYPSSPFTPAPTEAANRPLAQLAGSFLAKEMGDDERALSTLESLQERYPASQWVGLFLVRFLLEQGDFLPDDQRLAKALTILKSLSQAAEATPDVLALLGDLLQGANQPQEAQPLYRRALEIQPRHGGALAGLIQLASEQQWIDLLEEVRGRLESFGPQDGWAQMQLLELARSEGDSKTTLTLLENLGRLYPWESYTADWHELNRNLPAAISFLEARHADIPESPAIPYSIAMYYARMGEQEKMRSWLERTTKLDPQGTEAKLDLVHLDCLEGKLDSAHTRLKEALDRDPGNAHLRQLLAHFEGRTAFESYRVDSMEVVQSALARPTPNDADTELVLDQLMVRLFADGSQMRYTHLLRRVLSKAGVDEESEIALPEDSEVLQLRTIKPDGTILYPADIEHKNSISLSGVSIGDFIDEEHIQYLSPAYYDQDGADASMSFIFQGIDRIYHHSELVLIYPVDLKPEPTILSRNFPFPLQREERNGLVYLRWLAKEMPAIAAEPGMPQPSYFLPTASFSFNTSYREIADFFHHAIAPRLRATEALREEMGQWFPQEMDQASRARKIYEFVVENIEGENEFYRDINHVWAGRSGNATLLLLCAFRQIGLPTDLVLTRPKEVEIVAKPLPMPEYFSYGLLRIRLPGGTNIYVDANHKNLEFGYFPQEYRGAQALIIGEAGDGELFTLPRECPGDDAIAFAYTLLLDEQGAMSGEGTETFHGLFATTLQQRYAQLNEPEIRQRVESGINANYPGARVQSAHLLANQLRGSFAIGHEFVSDSFAEKSDQGLILPRLLPESILMANFGKLPSRKLPLQLRRPLINRGSLKLEFPSGLKPVFKPIDLHLKSAFGSYELTLTKETPNTLRITRAYDIPDQIIPPEKYPEFLAFLRTIEEKEIQVRIQARKN